MCRENPTMTFAGVVAAGNIPEKAWHVEPVQDGRVISVTERASPGLVARSAEYGMLATPWASTILRIFDGRGLNAEI